jgi:hypothetical protein
LAFIAFSPCGDPLNTVWSTELWQLQLFVLACFYSSWSLPEEILKQPLQISPVERMATPNRTYVSNGQVLETSVLHSHFLRLLLTSNPHSPPLFVRLSQQLGNVYNFFGLYFTSLLSVRVKSAHPDPQMLIRVPRSWIPTPQLNPLNSTPVGDRERLRASQDGVQAQLREVLRHRAAIQGHLALGVGEVLAMDVLVGRQGARWELMM